MAEFNQKSDISMLLICLVLESFFFLVLINELELGLGLGLVKVRIKS